ncbi:MAG: hypothetical protein Q9210_005015, partial [Variospora velana]
MRSFMIQFLLYLSVTASALASPPPDGHQLNTVEDVLSETKGGPMDAGAKAGATNSEAVSETNTIFNDQEVPPMKELNGDNFEKDTKKGYWFIKHYSPYCHHCQAIAPTWQTLYEYYYTSQPVSSSKPADTKTSLNSFERYYDFHFASIDCIAYGDACSKHEITAFPTFSLYKDTKFVKKFDGHKDMAGLSAFVEETLESVRPGSRPTEGVKLPEPGATSVDTGLKSDVTANKDKDADAGRSAGSKHKDTVSKGDLSTSAVDAEATEKAKSKSLKIPTLLKKPSTTPNPAGVSISLSQESFQKLVTNTQDPWFVKFYAPWCHHCQALAPSWHQMGKELQGKLNIGEVNCDVEARLCKDVRVKGYPTIHFFRGGERVEYEGLRGLGDLVSYARKALDIGMGVIDVDATAFKELEETEEVIFLYFYDHATTTEDFAALERLTLSLVGHAKLVKTDSAALAERFKISTWPRLLVSRDGRPSYYNALSPADMRDFRRVLSWMQSVWLPIVPELSASNSREIMTGKYLVLGILSRERADEFILDKREIKNAALDWMEKQTHAFQLERQELRDSKTLRIEEAEDRSDQRALRNAKSIRIDISENDKKQVGFAWVDGVFWDRWIRTTYGINVAVDGERVVIIDEDNHRYWDRTVSGAPIVPSRTSILETIPKVTSNPPQLSAKSTTGAIQHAFFQARGGMASHPILSLALLIGVVVGAYWGKGRIRRGKGGVGGGFFQLDGKEGWLNGGGPYNSHHIQLRSASTTAAVAASTPPDRDVRSLLTHLKNLLLGTSIGLTVILGYYYVTDTRASVHEWLVIPCLRYFYPDAEDAHEFGNRALKALYSFGVHPRERGLDDAKADLAMEVFGHLLQNPIGTSAGLVQIDKHCDIPDALLAAGPAVIEIGGVTPQPQEGNPKPRVWRIPSQKALINRYGLNSDGADHVAMRLRQRVREYAYHMGWGIDEEAEQRILDGEAGVPPGSLQQGRLMAVQIAKNKWTVDTDIEMVKKDYVYCVDALARYADVVVVNVSSPNTPGLRGLQKVEPLTDILTAVVAAARKVKRKTPPKVMVKVSPDEDSDSDVKGICDAVWDSGVDGVVVGNTTKKRPDPTPSGYLPTHEQRLLLEQGGYSGPQTFARTVTLVKRYRTMLDDSAYPRNNDNNDSESIPPPFTSIPSPLETPAVTHPPTTDAEIDASVARDKEHLKPPTPEAEAESTS